MKRKKITAMLTAILCAASTFAAFPAMNAQAVQAVYNDFETTYNGWHGSNDIVGFEAQDGAGYAGSRGMRVFDRQTAADGAASSKGFYLFGGVAYTYSVKVKADTDETFRLSVLTLDEQTEAPTVKELAVKDVKAGEWTTITAKYTAPADSFEFELNLTTDSTADFYMDDVEVTTKEDTTALTASAADRGLKDVFGNYFKVGNILNGGTVRNSGITANIIKDCNALECENETKPDAVLVQQGSTDNNIKVSLNSCSAIMDFCVQNNISFRGHTMVWHSQMPQWFFKQGFNAGGNWVDKNTMNTRMESAIKNTFTAITTQYPTLDLYAYDVCNECVSDDSNRTKNNGGARTPGWGNGNSPWVQIYGSNEFVEKAFTYARKYAPMSCKLFYNDYNEYWDHKRDCIYNMCKSLYEKGVLDGVGMQSHINADKNGFSGLDAYIGAMKKYLSIGCDVQITELDISVESGKFSYSQQADKYEAIFKAAMDWNTNPQSTGRVTLVQIWGPNDANSWLSQGSNALLYDSNNQPKEAYKRLMAMSPSGDPAPVEPTTEPKPDENGFWLNADFDNSTGSFAGRGGATAEVSSSKAVSGSKSMFVSGRTAEWNGAQTTLNSRTFKAGESYSFSANALYTGGGDADTFYLSLQYTGSDGETHYDHIAEDAAAKDNWVQLTNKSYKIPAGASDLVLYVEMPNSTSDFYIDDIIVAKDGTEISGPGASNIRIRTSSLRGDVDGDGVIDAFDLALAKRGMVKGFANKYDEQSADIDGNGKVEVTDVITLSKFVHKLIDKFPEPVQPPTEEVKSMSMKEFTAQCQAKMAMNEPDSAKQEKGGVQYGTVKQGTYFSTTCNRNKPYNILLPAGYDPSKKYPVLYCMHGYWENQDRMIIKGNGTMYTRQIIGNAIAEGEAKDMIVVFPYIYSSATQENCSGMDDNNNRAYDNFINDLTKDLMPHIEKTYSVKTGKDNTAITGFSMGGRESLAIGMTLSDKFGYIGAICPAPGVNDAYKGGWKFDAGKEPYLIMITAGGNDQTVYDTPKPYHENLEKNGVPHIWHYYPAGYHGDNSIHAHLYNFCRFVFQATN